MKPASRPIFQTWFLMVAALCWILDLLANLYLPHTCLHDPSSSLIFKGRLMLFNFAVWSIFWASIGLVVDGLRLAFHRLGWEAPRFIIQGTALPLVMSGTGFYLLNWMVYRQAGFFIDWQDVQFIRANCRELLFGIAAVQPRDLVFLVTATIVLSLGLYYVWGDLTRRWNDLQKHRPCRWPFLLLLLTISFAAPLLSDGKGSFFPLARDHTGPLLHLLTDGFNRLQDLFHHRSNSPEIEKFLRNEQKRKMEMAAYLNPQRANIKPYNVIYISIESLRRDVLSSCGAANRIMPSLDHLAETSVVFPNLFSESTYTGLAEATAVSSQYPLRGDVELSERIRFPRVMIFDILKAMGYRTAYFGSQNLLWEAQLNYLDTGGLETIVHAQNSNGKTYVESGDTGIVFGIARRLYRVGYVEDRATLADATLWIERHSGAPFFLYLNLQRSHFPYAVPSDVPPVFTPAEITFPVSFAQYPYDKIPVMRNRYHNSLHYIDSLLGAFLARLKTLHRFDNTILIITTDHGEAFGEHGLVTHGSYPYDEVLRVPLILHAPGLHRGINPAAIQHVDIAPSVLRLLGLRTHPAMQGKDFLRPQTLQDRAAFAIVDNSFARAVAVIQKGYKLIYDLRSNRACLYDLKDDPGEKKDIFSKRPKIAAHLESLMKFWIVSQVTYYTDPAIYENYYPPSYE